MKNNGRLVWLDIAKGLTILLVIVGHTVPYDSATRNVIYSFHMPLFFLLSGYTYRFSDTYAEFKVQAKKVFKRLIFPVFYISLIVLVFQIILYSHGEFSVILKYIFDSIKAIYYSSGIPFKGHPALGALWFLISLFWAKIIIDIVHINFKGKNEDYIYFALGLLGIALGIKGRWLAQNLDVTLVSILYIYIGILWKKYNEWIGKRELIIFIIATIIWTYFLSVHMYLEMAARSYPGILLSSLEAVCGTFFVCCICKSIIVNSYLTKIFSFLGRYSLVIFCIHCLDFLVPFVWQTDSLKLTILFRFCFIFGLFSIWYLFKVIYKNICNKIVS